MSPSSTTSDAPALRREPQQARSRARLAGLLDAAESLLVREGPEALTTTRIAEEAGVSVGSLYRWFPDKGAIVDALTRRYLAEFEATIDELAQAAPTAAWDDPAGMLLDVFAHRGVSQPGYRALWLGRHFSEELQAADRANKAILADGVRRILVGSGTIADSEEAATACRAGVLAADALLHEAFRLDPDGDPELMAEGKELLRAYLRTAARRFPPGDNPAPVSDTPLSRRHFLGTGVAAGAAAAAAGLPGAEDAEAAKKKKRKRGRRTRTVDVAIVGAGFAGLTAARELVRDGRSVCVLEGRDRVGGRVWNRELGGKEESERGGTFVGPTQDHVIKLADTLGISRFPTYNQGENVYVADGQRSTFSDTLPTGSAPLDPTILLDLATVISALNEMAATVPPDAPWRATRAKEWDGQTFESWLNANSTSERFRRLAAVACRPIFGGEPRELSLLFVLYYIASSGNERTLGTFERNFNTRNGAQEQRFRGGSQQIAHELHKRLGKRVVLRSPVKKIVQGRSSVRVESSRLIVKAKRVIVAVPPVFVGQIDFTPDLPADRAALNARVPQGTLLKVAAVYDTPFWRAKGLTGQALSLTGPVVATFDDSPPDGSPGVVFGFIGGDDARAFRKQPAAARRSAVLENFATYFGPEARAPKDYFETDWPGERFSRGGPVGILGPGTLTAYGPALRTPVRRVHWAGTETAIYWNGYMDGAVSSGERAAREVMDAL